MAAGLPVRQARSPKREMPIARGTPPARTGGSKGPRRAGSLLKRQSAGRPDAKRLRRWRRRRSGRRAGEYRGPRRRAAFRSALVAAAARAGASGRSNHRNADETANQQTSKRHDAPPSEFGPTSRESSACDARRRGSRLAKMPRPAQWRIAIAMRNLVAGLPPVSVSGILVIDTSTTPAAILARQSVLIAPDLTVDRNWTTAKTRLRVFIIAKVCAHDPNGPSPICRIETLAASIGLLDRHTPER
jgi:hypothetical protein